MSRGQSYHLQEDKLPSLSEVSVKGLRIKQAEKTDFYGCQKGFETHSRSSRKLLLPLSTAVTGSQTLSKYLI